MAITYTDNGTNTPNGTHKIFTYTFPVLKTEDIKVALNGIVQATTKYTASLSPAQIEFNSTNADATVQNTSTGAPLSGVLVRVYRQTTVGKNSGDEDPKAVFAAGSSIRATDLNANQEQALFAIHELQNQEVLQEKIGTGAVTSAKILDGTIVDADINASADINGIKVNPNFGSQNISTTGTINNLTTTELAILDGATVSTAELNILDGATVTTAELNKLDGFTGNVSELNLLHGVTATTAEINKLDGATVTTSEINILDGVTATATEINKLDGVTATTSELNILDGVTATATELNVLDGISVTTNELNNVYGIGGNIQSQLDNKQPIDAELTELATMSSGTASALADLTQAEVQTLDGITATTAEINLNDGQTATPTEVNILDGATLNTTELNKLDGLTSSTTELNLLDGKSIVTSISGSATDTQIPSAQAVNERITTVVQDVGGFVPIANETSFPTANPDLNDAAGTIVSIKALASAFTTGSGVTTHTISNGAGSGKNVTITGLTQATTYPAGRGLILETTQYSGGGRGGDANEYEYAFHRLTLDETGVADAQAAIDDFDERYYGPFSANQATRPSGANRLNGDLYFNTSDGKMKVFNGSHASGTWDDVAAPGNFFINTLSSSSGSGGGSATFNGTATRFTLSNPPLTAQQLLVSVNGVVQKPNSGTSPSEGFAISGADIIFASAPAASSPYFIITIGSSVNIGTPSNDTVGAAQIIDGSITNAEISSSAAIAKSKLASLNILNADVNASAAIARTKLANVDLVDDTTPQLGGNLDTNGNSINFGDSSSGSDDRLNFGAGLDMNIYHDASAGNVIKNGATTFSIINYGENMIVAKPNDSVELYWDGSKKFETFASGVRAANDGHIKTASDSGKFMAGVSDDLQIYHNGSDSFIKNDTQTLRILADSFQVDNNANTEVLINALANGAVELYYDGSKKFHTYSEGCSIFGNLNLEDSTGTSYGRLRIGNSSDLELYHDGSHSVIKNNTGTLYNISDTSIILQAATGGDLYAKFIKSGAVELYHGGARKFRTHSSGAVFEGNLNGGDNDKITLGGADDLQIYHDGSHSRIVDSGTGNLILQTSKLNINNADNTKAFIHTGSTDGVELYFDGSKKIETDTHGAVLTGRLRVEKSGDTSINVKDSSSNAVSAYVEVKTAGRVEYNCYKEGVGTKYPHVFMGYTEEYARIDAAGLKFNGDTATANALDDYEEGTWTPVLQAYTGTQWDDVTYDNALDYTQGNYVKIGSTVFIYYYTGNFDLASGWNTAYARINGLPFAFRNAAPYYGGIFTFTHTNCFKDQNNNLFDCHSGYGVYSQNYINPSIGNSPDQAKWGSESNRYMMVAGVYQTNV